MSNDAQKEKVPTISWEGGAMSDFDEMGSSPKREHQVQWNLLGRIVGVIIILIMTFLMFGFAYLMVLFYIPYSWLLMLGALLLSFRITFGLGTRVLENKEYAKILAKTNLIIHSAILLPLILDWAGNFKIG